MSTYKHKFLRSTVTFFLLFAALAVAITSCNRPSADQFFQTTILNTNILHEFATEQFTKTLWSTTITYGDSTGTAATEKTMEAQQIVDAKIAYIQQTIERIEAMTPPDEEGKIIKEKSLDLYRYVLPVYQNEYHSMAKKCDEKATEEAVKAIETDIAEKYAVGFEERYVALIDLGKAYAEQHSLNVQFGN